MKGVRFFFTHPIQGVSKKSRPFQIQIIHSLLYYFEYSNWFKLMDRKNTKLLLMGQNNSKKYV